MDHDAGGWLYTNYPSSEWVMIPSRYLSDFRAWAKQWRRRQYIIMPPDAVPTPEIVSDWLMWRMSEDV